MTGLEVLARSIYIAALANQSGVSVSTAATYPRACGEIPQRWYDLAKKVVVSMAEEVSEDYADCAVLMEARRGK